MVDRGNSVICGSGAFAGLQRFMNLDQYWRESQANNVVQVGPGGDVDGRCPLCCQVAQRKLGSMPLALRALPSAGTCMVLGERLELLSLSPSSSPGAARLALRPLDVPPALHATPLRLADGPGCDSRYLRDWVRIGFGSGFRGLAWSSKVMTNVDITVSVTLTQQE